MRGLMRVRRVDDDGGDDGQTQFLRRPGGSSPGLPRHRRRGGVARRDCAVRDEGGLERGSPFRLRLGWLLVGIDDL